MSSRDNLFEPPWTSEEDAEISRQLRENGHIGLVRISGRSNGATLGRIRRLRRSGKLKRSQARWTKKQDDKLLGQLAQGKKYGEMVIYLPGSKGNKKKNRFQISKRISTLLKKRPSIGGYTKSNHRRWTSEEEATLYYWTCTRKRGPGFIFNYKKLDRTYDAICRRISNKGWARPEARERRRRIKRRNSTARLNLKKFLLSDQGRYMPNPLVAKRFRISNSTVRKERHDLGISLTIKEARAAVKRYKQKPPPSKVTKRSPISPAQKRQAFVALFRREEAKGCQAPCFPPCKICGETWFRTLKFYIEIPNQTVPDKNELGDTCRYCLWVIEMKKKKEIKKANKAVLEETLSITENILVK